MIKKSMLITLSLLLSLTLFTGCNSSKPAPASAPAPATDTTVSSEAPPALEQKDIVLGTARDPQLASEMIVAKAEGYFSAEGLNVDLQMFPSGSDLTAAISGKSVPIGSAGDSPSTILRSTAGQVSLIAQQADISGTQALVVNPNVIKTPADLNNKKIAYSSGNTSEALFISIVEKYGLNKDSMTIYNMGGSEALIAFQKGEIDAFVLWEPTIINAVKAGGVRLLSASTSYVPGQEGPQKLIGAHSLLIADTDYIKKNPETTKAVLRALNKAVAFINQNPDKAAEYVASALSTDVEDTKTMMSFNKYSLAITPELIEDITKTAQFLQTNGKIKEIPDYSQFVDSSYLSELDASLVTWKP